MRRSVKRRLSVILSACFLLASALPALAAGDCDDPNVFLSKGVYSTDDGYADGDTTVTYDPASGTLTVDDRDNAVPIADEAAFCEWIRSVAEGVRTVYLPKTSTLRNFSFDETELEDGWDGAYPSNVFWKAFSCLYNLERFVVEKGNPEFEAKDGVLYTRHCYDLVHYPAAKPDKAYRVDDWCMMGIYPYAFCNTRYLERLELPYTHCGNADFLLIEEYAFSAMDIADGTPRESSIRQIVYNGTKKEFSDLLSYREGNDAAEQAEIVCKPTDLFHDIIAYIKVNYFIYFRMMLDWLPYQRPEKTDLFPYNTLSDD